MNYMDTKDLIRTVLFDTGIVAASVYHFFVSALPTAGVFIVFGAACLQLRWWWLKNKQLNIEIAEEAAKQLVEPVAVKVIDTLIKKEKQ
jgi:hypothetical protein